MKNDYDNHEGDFGTGLLYGLIISAFLWGLLYLAAGWAVE